MDKKRIVILGGGFAGAYCAQELEKHLKPAEAEIILLDRNNYFIFYPLLVEAGTGGLEPRHAVVSIRAFLSRTQFRMAEILSVDPVRHAVQYRRVGSGTPESLTYDHLVMALGSVTRAPAVPGLREHAYEMKSLADAVGLRDRAIQMLEAADALADERERRARLHFVVVGGNFTGVEVAGEFQVFLRKASRFYRNVRARECNVTLVELSDRILPALDRDLSEYARTHLVKRGMDIRLGASVARIEPDHVVLTNGERLAAHTVIWAAGIAPPTILTSTGLPLDERGYLLCERDLRVKGHDTIWGIGDSAVNPDARGVPYPATAQHAVRQGLHAARNIAAAMRGQPLKPCDLLHLGALAALGCRTAVAKVFGLRLSGFPAWFLWRTVYLFKMPQWSRRARIALDWTLDLFFKRDYVQLGIHRSGLRAQAPIQEEPDQPRRAA